MEASTSESCLPLSDVDHSEAVMSLFFCILHIEGNWES